MQSVQERISHFISIFRSYKQQIEQIEVENKQKKVTKEIVPDIAKELFGVQKKHVRGAQEYFSSPQQDPFQTLKRAIGREIIDLEQFLSTCTILNPDGTKSARKPSSYISQVRKVRLPKTKVKWVLEGLNQLKHLGTSLVYEKDFVPKKQVKEKREKRTISSSEELWRKIKSGDIGFLVEMDETEYFDRKLKGIEDKKIEDTIVAMANTQGGIIAFGYSDDKGIFPLSSQKRDGIQNQITNICRKNISPKITPKFKTIIHELDQGFLLVHVPEKKNTLFTNKKQQHLKRVGSNNETMTPEEIKDFYQA